MTYLQLAKEFWTSGNNILLRDHNDGLWLAGCNYSRKSGIQNFETVLGHPHNLKLSLSSDETVTEFKSYIRNLFILTNHKRLIVFRCELRFSYDAQDENYMTGFSPSYNKSYDNSTQLDLLNNTFFNKTLSSIPTEEKSPSVNTIPLEDAPIVNQDLLFERSNDIEHSLEYQAEWRLLSWDDFSNLRGKARNDYITQTREMISNSIGDENSWTQSEEMLSLAIQQIESPAPIDPETAVCKPVHHHIGSLSWNSTNSSIVIYNNVDGIVFGPSRIIFKIGNRFVVEVINTASSAPNTKFKNLPLTKIQMTPNSYLICEACVPSYDEYHFMKDFIHLRNNARGLNYLIFPTTDANDIHVKWINFPDPFVDFNPEILHWNRRPSNNLIYFINDEVLWYHDNDVDKFIKTSTRSDELLITRTPYDDAIYIAKNIHELCVISNYTLQFERFRQWIFSFDAKTPLSQVQLYNIKCCNGSGCNGLSIMVCNSTIHVRSTNTSNIDVLPARTGKFDHYGALNDKMFVYIEANIMYTISCNCYSSDKIATYNTYPLPIPDSEISSLSLRESVIIESNIGNYQYIYYAFYCSSFMFFQQLISPDLKVQIQDSDLPLNEHLLFKQMITHRNMTFSVKNLTNCLDLLLDNLESIQTTTLIYVDIRDEYTNRARGQGVRYSFFTKAAEEFANLYLTRHNHVTEFHGMITLLSIDKLRDLGKALALMLFNLQSNLLIRLPLILVYAIKCRLPTESDLELIAGFEDPEALTVLQQIRNDRSALRTAGFQDYYSGLETICKFDRVYEMFVRQIAYGFLTMFRSQNISAMNFLTLDQYLSGKYSYDIKRFLRQIRMIKVPDELQTVILKEIDALSQNEFVALLLNWSGKSTIVRTGNYDIEFTKKINSVVLFSTCFRSIKINSDYIGESPYEDFTLMLKTLLTVKCDEMAD